MTKALTTHTESLKNRANGDVVSVRASLVLSGIAYLVFVIYGSLVPLTFRAMPIDAAVAAFKSIRYLSLDIQHRADWVANLLLFIPLAFLWNGALSPRSIGVRRMLVGLTIWLACVALSVGIEFIQLFFPPRTVSINDIVAESIGGLIGVSLWWLIGARFQIWLGSLSWVRGTAGVAERLLMVYLIVMLGYNLLPLDLTLSVVELYHKWNEGRILLIPFSARYDDSAKMVYDLLSDVVVWVPVALLWKVSSTRPNRTVWLHVVVTAAVIEVLQLFVYSRVTDTTDVITAAIGGAVGLVLAGRGRANQISQRDQGAARIGRDKSFLSFAIVIWLGVLATVFWYPFEFNFDRAFVRDRLLGLNRVPFTAYYFGSEFRAITEVLHKTLFMLPLGILLGWMAGKQGGAAIRIARHVGVVIFIVLTAIGIEAGQVFLVTKNADITDALLETAGGILGYGGCLSILGLLHHPIKQRY